MTRFPFLRTILVAMLATTVAMPTMSTSAAIPCQELPVIEPDPDMVITMIYIELPVTVEAAFDRRQPADRTGQSQPSEDAGNAKSAAENQFRCLNYGNDVAFAGNSTPEQRVSMWNRPAVDASESPYIDVDSVFVERLSDPVQLTDGRLLIDFAIIVNGSQYLTGEMVFAENDGGLYLDSTAIDDSVTLNQAPVEVELLSNFDGGAETVYASEGDRVVFKNLEEKASADIIIESAEGAPVFNGGVMGNMMVGGENRNIFVVHDIEPGEYKVTVTYPDDNVSYSQTLVIGTGDTATPVASPAG